MPDKKKNSSVRRLSGLMLAGCLGCLLLTLLVPVNNTLLRMAYLGSFVGIQLSLLALLWRRQAIRWSLLIMPPVFVTFVLALPGHPVDTQTLRQDYMSRLEGFRATTYIWGGENALGIDCSGLPRRALMEALFSQGVKTANGNLIRSALTHWWYDASALALSKGYRDYAQATSLAGTIRGMDYTALEPGDLAITTSGVHALVFLGGEKWIQADPGLGEVAILNGRSDANAWFDSPVAIYRWTWFYKTQNIPQKS